MRIGGRIIKSGGFWAVDVPLLDVATQGRTRAEAFLMIADAVEMLVRRKGFRLRIFPGRGGNFEIGSADEGALIALVLKRIRAKAGLSLAEAASRLGSQSPNSYARYEQGRSAPSVRKLSQLYAAVERNKDLVLTESRAAVKKPASVRRKNMGLHQGP